MSSFIILVVDDDMPTAESLSSFLERRSFSVRTANTGEKGLDEIRNNYYDAVLLDIHLPGISGIELLAEIRALQPGVSVIMMTAFASIDTAISALRLGATDYVIKPFDPDEILLILDRLVERKELIETNEEFSNQARTMYDFSNIVTRDPKFLDILESVKKAAETNVAVVITGESGTGKELVARALHNNSDRAKRPLIAVNCAAISPALMESEFFGHVKGSFTSAHADHKGYFERAHNSTLFLDEIGELPIELQAKLLRVLQEGQINRVGESRPIDLDVRLIAATQKDLAQEVKQGRFRKDLFYRLNTFMVVLPPLRERLHDVPILVKLFMSRSAKPGIPVSEETMEALMDYDWPGNVRELENVIVRAAILAQGKEIRPNDLPLSADQDEAGYFVKLPMGVLDYKDTVKKVSDLAGRKLIMRALAEHDYNISKSAPPLGVSRRFLTYSLKKFGIKNPGNGENGE